MTHHDKKLKKHDRKPSVWCSNSTPGHLCCSHRHGFPQLGSTQKPWAKHTATIKKLPSVRTDMAFPSWAPHRHLGPSTGLRSKNWLHNSTPGHLCCSHRHGFPQLGSTLIPWAKHTATIKKLAPQLNSWTPLLFAPTWLSPAGLHSLPWAKHTATIKKLAPQLNSWMRCPS